MKMGSLIERVWKQALITFARSNSNVTLFKDNFAKLKSLADSVNAVDVKLDRRLLDWTSNNISSKNVRKPPVTYIEIYEDSAVTIGIFILRAGVRIPLHDHPHMHGILKVLTGTIHLQSYSELTPDEQEDLRTTYKISRHAMLVEKSPGVKVNEEGAACVLTPDVGNLHEIHSVDGPAAFLDILAPPYDSSSDNERSCHYFEEIRLDDILTLKSKNVVALFRVPSPPEFWSDAAPYKGPELTL